MEGHSSFPSNKTRPNGIQRSLSVDQPCQAATNSHQSCARVLTLCSQKNPTHSLLLAWQGNPGHPPLPARHRQAPKPPKQKLQRTETNVNNLNYKIHCTCSKIPQDLTSLSLTSTGAVSSFHHRYSYVMPNPVALIKFPYASQSSPPEKKREK